MKSYCGFNDFLFDPDSLTCYEKGNQKACECDEETLDCQVNILI